MHRGFGREKQQCPDNISLGKPRHREFGGASCLSLGLDANAVINGALDFLLAAKLAFCGLHRDMPEQKLDLFELSTCNVTEPGACLLFAKRECIV